MNHLFQALRKFPWSPFSFFLENLPTYWAIGNSRCIARYWQVKVDLPASLTLVANCPVSTAPGGHTFPEIYTIRCDTDSKFATVFNDACSKLLWMPAVICHRCERCWWSTMINSTRYHIAYRYSLNWTFCKNELIYGTLLCKFLTSSVEIKYEQAIICLKIFPFTTRRKP